MLARHVSDITGPSSGAFCTSCIRRLWYVVLLCVLLDTSSRYEVVGRILGRTSRQSTHEGDKAVTPTHRSTYPPPPRTTPGTHFCYRLSSQGRSSAGSIKSKKNPNDLLGSRTRYLPACSSTNCSTAYQNEDIMANKGLEKVLPMS